MLPLKRSCGKKIHHRAKPGSSCILTAISNTRRTDGGQKPTHELPEFARICAIPLDVRQPASGIAEALEVFDSHAICQAQKKIRSRDRIITGVTARREGAAA